MVDKKILDEIIRKMPRRQMASPAATCRSLESPKPAYPEHTRLLQLSPARLPDQIGAVLSLASLLVCVFHCLICNWNALRARVYLCGKHNGGRR